MKNNAIVVFVRLTVACIMTAIGYWLIQYYSHTGGILYWLTFIFSPGVWLSAVVSYFADSIGAVISAVLSYIIAIAGNYAFIMVLTFIFRKANSCLNS